MDILEEISEFNTNAEKQGIVRTFYAISSEVVKSTTENDEKKIINFCSNDYLRLSKNSEIINAGIEEIRKSGTGSGGTRNISGTNLLHIQLEKKIAQFHNKEDSVLFNSAYNANVGALSSLGKCLTDVTFFSDSQNHASIIHGINLSNAKKVIYSHNDLEELEQRISQNNSKNKIIVCESIYSMSGTQTDISKLVEISQKHGCIIYLDEVHAIGVYGNGKGVAFEQGFANEIHIINGTFGKAAGCLGGYIASTASIAKFVKLNATTFIFSTSLPPFICASVLKSLEIMESEEYLRTKLFENVNFLKNLLKEKKINILENKSHIIIIPIHSILQVKEISKNLLKNHSIYIQPIFYPTVPLGKELFRITCCPQHTKEEINFLVDKLSEEFENSGSKKSVTLIARKSILSRAQSELFAQKLQESYPQYFISLKYIATFGDRNTQKPIHDLEYTNAFTREIEDLIKTNINTIGVSSLKDIEIKGDSSEIQVECFLERINPRDILILNENAKNKIHQGNKVLQIGTSSLRRAYLFKEIHTKILPNNTHIEIIPIRGNIDTRIKRTELPENDIKYLDGVILSAAGLIRLQTSENYQEQYKDLVNGKVIITLPIPLFPTPPGQGIIACQTIENFAQSLKDINHTKTAEIAKKEKKLFHKYGAGCRQGFGVTHLSFKKHECTFIKGITDQGRILDITIQEDFQLTKEDLSTLCDSRMFDLYEREEVDYTIPNEAKKFFVATKYAVTTGIIHHLKDASEVWASGIKTHEFLVKNGILCNGSVESLGFDELANIRLPLDYKTFYTLTYKSDESVNDPFTIHTYSMKIKKYSQGFHDFCEEITKANTILWTSLQLYKDFVHLTIPEAKHICMLGKTYDYISQNKKNIIGIFNFDVLDSYIEYVKNE